MSRLLIKKYIGKKIQKYLKWININAKSGVIIEIMILVSISWLYFLSMNILWQFRTWKVVMELPKFFASGQYALYGTIPPNLNLDKSSGDGKLTGKFFKTFNSEFCCIYISYSIIEAPNWQEQRFSWPLIWTLELEMVEKWRLKILTWT